MGPAPDVAHAFSVPCRHSWRHVPANKPASTLDRNPEVLKLGSEADRTAQDKPGVKPKPACHHERPPPKPSRDREGL